MTGRLPSSALILLLTVVAVVAAPPVRVHAEASACDRPCLTEIMTRYLNALVARDPSSLPLAAGARFTEDGIDLKLGDGLWKSSLALGPYRFDFVDTREGVVATHAVLEEGASPILFAARLKVADRRITEIETIVAHNADEAVLFAPNNLTAPTTAMAYVPKPAERMPREQMVNVAARYPAGLRAGSFVTADVPFAPASYRFENGVRMAGPGCTFQPPSCEDMRAQRIPTLPDVKQRLIAVDEEMGTVLFRLDFGRGSLPGAKYDGKSLVTFEAFKVYGGQVHAAEAVFKALPLNAPSGWDPPATADASARAALQRATAEDHRDMLRQLGIRALRPGPSGNESAPDHANYDEARANPFPNLPDVLTLKNGRKVATADAWWKQRRPEIDEDFDREVFGRVPKNTPAVTWSVTSNERSIVAGRPVVVQSLVGRVDNSAYPAIVVDMHMTLVVPAEATARVPIMVMFTNRALPVAAEQLVAHGWGYAALNPTTIQADNGAGLTKGIIGLVNHGQRRAPDDWGALRAWAWGASRALDYLQAQPQIDAKRVGVEGVSRYGKAALVAMAYDQRFAVVLVGSSGEGGAKLHRRNWGEAVENLTAAGEYHWMAGNFLKYGAAEATFGSRNAGDLPVDAHELIALCAPRPTFISYGVPEKGDARWLDHQGSFMAAIAAQPVFTLLGARGLGRSNDYHIEKMPAVNVPLLDGQLAWRQHDGGHTDGPNWQYFVPWATRMLGGQPQHGTR